MHDGEARAAETGHAEGTSYLGDTASAFETHQVTGRNVMGEGEMKLSHGVVQMFLLKHELVLLGVNDVAQEVKIYGNR